MDRYFSVRDREDRRNRRFFAKNGPVRTHSLGWAHAGWRKVPPAPPRAAREPARRRRAPRRVAMPARLDGLPQPDSSIHPTGVGKGEHALEQRRANQVALLRHWGLLPSSRLLEIGCGVGWLAYDLAFVLDDTGSYAGFDVGPEAIGWLNEHLAPRLPNFRFDAVDVHNPKYRPEGGGRPETFRFPYADDEFDFVCAFGLFMHMPLPGVDNYLRETARVLRPGSRALLNFMAITEADTDPRNAHRPYVRVRTACTPTARIGWIGRSPTTTR